MNYGYFDDNNREYVITNPRTPTKWINYIGTLHIVSEIYGILTEVTIFVPTGAEVEVRDIKITNVNDQPIKVDAIPVLEYTHPDALKQFTNADWIPQTMQSKAVKDGECTVLTQYPFMFRDIKVNYFTSNLPASSFETDRKKFLGENEYGTWTNPVSLQNDELSNTEASRGDNIAALLFHLGTLQPRETKRLITQLGQVHTLVDAKQSIETWRDPKSVDDALDAMKKYWDDYLSVLQVETPDLAFNSTVNIHNPHQCHTTRQWSRYLSYYQLGLGARGIGIRDSSQDILGVIANDPQGSKDFLKQLLSFQRQNGSALHAFNPLTLEGSVGDSLEREDRPHYYSDDHLWSVLCVTAYIKETGDVAFLDEKVHFYEKDSVEGVSVLDHVKQALTFTRNDTGKHGLPLLGFADWNDTINLAKGAESLFTAHLYGRALNEFIGLLDYLGKNDEADKWQSSCRNEVPRRRARLGW